MHPLVELARKSIETYVKEKKMLKPPDALSEEMKEQAGVFVSLKKKGELRGCIGTFAPTTESVAQEVIRNAIESATRDPRFPPVQLGEVKDLEISVDVLTTPLRVNSLKDLDPKKYGVVVRAGQKRGLLLPDLPGVTTAEQQVGICMQKGGIAQNEAVELYRFEVKRYK